MPCSLWNSRNRRTALIAATSLHIVPATCCNRNTKLKVEPRAHLTTGPRVSVRAESLDPNTCWFQLGTADYTRGHGSESAWVLCRAAW